MLENIWVREVIIDIISILDSNKTTGLDKISNKMIISIKNEKAKERNHSDLWKRVFTTFITSEFTLNALNMT